ncbi:hypothetical protein K457DRAFT_141019 [Linnemannia elongata AG-77]|uniref:Uncharacterized protein n=1 Tax=Linnemannia elongata AG-77 TaxID=1314771 RepID=A0A197JMT2_9FUNG|nr:hypothetical protein K457DRAFT_141019 [Linnemannia elongata AG-77]
MKEQGLFRHDRVTVEQREQKKKRYSCDGTFANGPPEHGTGMRGETGPAGRLGG